MSILDKITLPPVVGAQAPQLVPDEARRFVIICMKDVPKEELEALQSVGRVVQWKDQYVNLPFDQLTPHDYLLIDARSKQARLTLAREDLSKYNVICYLTWLQKQVEDIVDQVNGVEITSIPLQVINQADMNVQLLNPKLKAPSVLRSFFSVVLQCLRK